MPDRREEHGYSVSSRMSYYVYILSNYSRVLYVGSTNDLPRRLFEHKMKLVKGFTQKCNITTLVYFETYDNRLAAEKREKQLKGYSRSQKIELIETLNPAWRELGFRFIYPELKAQALLESFKNRQLDGMQRAERIYGNVMQPKTNTGQQTEHTLRP
jgi:putative endonuclease